MLDAQKIALWETLSVVMAMRSSELIPLFRNIKVSTPWFDFGAATLALCSAFLVLAVLAA
jgi:hypothetical protein